jgi:hypothetical protein
VYNHLYATLSRVQPSLSHTQSCTTIFTPHSVVYNHLYTTLSRHKWTTTEPRAQHVTVWPWAAVWPGLISVANHTTIIHQYCPYFLIPLVFPVYRSMKRGVPQGLPRRLRQVSTWGCIQTIYRPSTPTGIIPWISPRVKFTACATSIARGDSVWICVCLHSLLMMYQPLTDWCTASFVPMPLFLSLSARSGQGQRTKTDERIINLWHGKDSDRYRFSPPPMTSTFFHL